MTQTVELVQDALAESFNEDFDITIIQDKLRRSLIGLYEGLEPADRTPLFDRYQAAFDAVEARNAKIDRFMPADEVKAMRDQLDEIMPKEEQDELMRSLAESELPD